MTQEDDRDEKIADLTRAAEEIVASVNSLNRESGQQLVSLTVRAKRNRAMLWGLTASLALGLGLTAFGINLAHKVDAAQQLTRNQVLCPLYQQFVNADTPEARKRAGQAGQNLKDRDEAFRVIHKSYDALRCADVER